MIKGKFLVKLFCKPYCKLAKIRNTKIFRVTYLSCIRNQLQFAGIRSIGFKDFLLKPELMKAVTDCGFEHPSEV